MNTMSNLLNFYNNTSKDDIYHITLGCILSKLDSIEDATIYDVSEICSVSTATIGRLSQKLGYKNFSEFRLDLVSAVKKFTFLNRVMPLEMCDSPDIVLNSYIQMLQDMVNGFAKNANQEKIAQIAEALHKAEKVRFYSYGKYYSEMPMQINLIADRKDALILTRYTEQLEDSKKLDGSCVVMIFATDSPDSADMEPIFRNAHEKGAKVILLTGSQRSQYMKYADFHIVNSALRIGTMLGSYAHHMYLDLINTFYRAKYIDKLWDGNEEIKKS